MHWGKISDTPPDDDLIAFLVIFALGIIIFLLYVTGCPYFKLSGNNCEYTGCNFQFFRNVEKEGANFVKYWCCGGFYKDLISCKFCKDCYNGKCCTGCGGCPGCGGCDCGGCGGCAIM